MGKEVEIISKGKESILMDPCPPLSIKVGKYPSVLTQQTMNISDKIV